MFLNKWGTNHGNKQHAGKQRVTPPKRGSSLFVLYPGILILLFLLYNNKNNTLDAFPFRTF